MRTVFVGTPAFLGRIDSQTRCAFWVEQPVDHDFDPGRLIDVDLARTPSAAAAGEIDWTEVQVDDCYAGPNGLVHGTTLGPSWPELRLSAAVCLDRGYALSLPDRLRPPCPPTGMQGHPYECMSAVYWPHINDTRAGKRYAGHHAVITDERDTVARLAVSEQCDAGPDSLTTIGVGDAPKSGAVFLICGYLDDGTQL